VRCLSFFQIKRANDSYDVLGFAAQTDVTSIANVGNHDSLVFNYLHNNKSINV
jgi:hypothetical protein